MDVAFAALLALAPTDTGDAVLLFLVYPLFAAAYRWGFNEVMITAMCMEAAILARLGAFDQSVQAVNAFILRATAVGGAGLTIGYLAESDAAAVSRNARFRSSSDGSGSAASSPIP